MMVTASVAGFNATLTETAGPHLVATYGNATGTRGSARPDGSYVGIGLDGDLEPDIGYDLFSPSGTVAGRLGPLQGSWGLPGIFDYMWSVLATPDQKLYFRSGIDTSINSAYVVQLDSGLNLAEFVDLDRSYEIEPYLGDLTGPTAIDSSGNIYAAEANCNGGANCNDSVFVFDPSGKNTGQVMIGQPIQAIAINNAGHIVAFVQPSTGAALLEYSLSGQLLNTPSIPPVSDLAQMVQDPSGNFVIQDYSAVYTFDQNYSMLGSVSFSSWLDVTQRVLSGVDAARNFYISSKTSTDVAKYDVNGNLVAVSAWPAQNNCAGCPQPASVNALVTPVAMAADPLTSDFYVTDNNNNFGSPWISRYSNGQYSARLSPTDIGSANDIAVSVSRKLYVADIKNGTVHILDLTGKIVGSLVGSQVGSPASIGIDSNDNKYVLDIANTSIHVLDSADQTVATLTLTPPSSFGTTISGSIRVAADGTLVVCFNDGSTYVLQKMSFDGSLVFSQSWKQSDFALGAATGDTKGNTFAAGYDQMKVLDPSGNVLGQFDINIYAGMDCGIAQQGDTALVCYANHIYGFAAQ